MSVNDNRDGPKDPLLDDDTFVELMDSEWKKSGSPVDHAAKARVWRRMELGSKLPRRTNWQVPTILAACFVGVILVGRSFLLPDEDVGQQYKGSPRATEVHIGFRIRGSDDGLMAWDAIQRQAGDIVLPYVEAKVRVAVALLRKGIGEHYELVAGPDLLVPGEEHFFSSNEESIAIQLEAEPETYCVLVGEEVASLTSVLSALPKLDLTSDSDAMDCFAL